MGRNRVSSTIVTEYKEKARREGSLTAKAEQEWRRTGKIAELVDPSKRYDVRGISKVWMQPMGGDPVQYLLARGIPMPVRTDVDTTTSMQDNLDKCLNSLEALYSLLQSGKQPILDRYDVHLCTGEWGDYKDAIPYMTTMFEMDERMLEQMRMMVPIRDGQDGTEDGQIALFSAAYFSKLDINNYGLLGYYFIVSDADTRYNLDDSILKNVFGDDVYKNLSQRGYGEINSRNIPDAFEMMVELRKKYFPFFLQVGTRSATTRSWEMIMGTDSMVTLPDTRLLAHLQAAVIGISEGVLDFQSLEEFLRSDQASGGFAQTGLNERDARLIKNAIAHIPSGLQKKRPGFDNLPARLSVFASPTDLWPKDTKFVGAKVREEEAEDDWL